VANERTSEDSLRRQQRAILALLREKLADLEPADQAALLAEVTRLLDEDVTTTP
jgi:hypothetical protein